MADLGQLLSTLASLQEFAAQVEQLRPVLENLGPLMGKLDLAEEALLKAQAENSELREQLEQQRQVFLHLIAQGMGIPVEQVLSMAQAIQEGLTHADSPARAANQDSDENRSSS